MSRQWRGTTRRLYGGCPCVSFNCCRAFEIADVLLIGHLHEGGEQMFILAECVATCQKEVGAEPSLHLLTFLSEMGPI